MLAHLFARIKFFEDEWSIKQVHSFIVARERRVNVERKIGAQLRDGKLKSIFVEDLTLLNDYTTLKLGQWKTIPSPLVI